MGGPNDGMSAVAVMPVNAANLIHFGFVYPHLFGKYVLERELARGGMARVVLATLRGAGGFEKRLVVKQIRDELSFDQQFVRRFVEEAKTTVALSHPNIVPVYELGVEQGTYFLAMELVEGCSIAEMVRARSSDAAATLTPEEGAYVGMEVCRALDYAHRRMKVVHRDITPRNVMLDEEGQVKLIDFGIAAPALVAGHEILGSPGHMPPEQVEGKELGPATDIFAVAVLLMEAWSGVAPFRRATPEACDEAMRQPHPKPSDYNPRLLPLDDVIVRAMQLDPSARQQDASDLGRALRAFLQGMDVTDIARDLGDRVRDLRTAASEPAPMSLPRPSRAPSVQELGTTTFAAREEALHWSRPPVEACEPPAASTRRLAATPEESVPDVEPARTSRSRDWTKPSGSPDPAMSIPTPLLVEPVGDLLRGAQAAQAAARAARTHSPDRNDHDYDEPADTVATRGFETAVRDSTQTSLRSGRPRAFAIVAFAIVCAVGAGALWRARSAIQHADVPQAATATAPAPADGTKSNSAPLPSASVRAPSPATSASVVPTMATAAAPRAAHSAALGTSVSKATVSFFGDPGTRVSVDGAPLKAAPVVGVHLEPGPHDVRFQFDPTGETRTERFTVKPAERVTVRAEFTGAVPSVRVQR